MTTQISHTAGTAENARAAIPHLHWRAMGAGTPIILLHGMYHSSFSFRHNVEALSQWGRVYVLDLPGHGNSPAPERALTNPELTALVLQFMDEQAIAKAVVLGSSASASIALRMAIESPQRVLGVVVVNGSPLPEKPHLSWTLLRWILSAQIDVMLGTRLSGSAWKAYFPSIYVRPDRLSAAERETIAAAGSRPGVAAAGMGMIKGFADLPQRLQEVRVPVLLLWGDQDREFPLSAAQRLHDRIPEAQLRVIPGTGHYPHEEDPSAFNAALVEWLKQLEFVRKEG